jgi:Protein of unknown function (DUF2946)
MDPLVARAMAKWPNVPAVYGWLSLDRRGNWLIKGERIANTALREFIGRNYACDSAGRWYFQNGPQRVFVRLAYTPWVVHYEGDALIDQCGGAFPAQRFYLDEEGSVLAAAERGIALVDDRDLVRFADAAAAPQAIRRSEIPARFGFQPEPKAA